MSIQTGASLVSMHAILTVATERLSLCWLFAFAQLLASSLVPGSAVGVVLGSFKMRCAVLGASGRWSSTTPCCVCKELAGCCCAPQGAADEPASAAAQCLSQLS